MEIWHMNSEILLKAIKTVRQITWLDMQTMWQSVKSKVFLLCRIIKSLRKSGPFLGQLLNSCMSASQSHNVTNFFNSSHMWYILGRHKKDSISNNTQSQFQWLWEVFTRKGSDSEYNIRLGGMKSCLSWGRLLLRWKRPLSCPITTSDVLKNFLLMF